MSKVYPALLHSMKMIIIIIFLLFETSNKLIHGFNLSKIHFHLSGPLKLI